MFLKSLYSVEEVIELLNEHFSVKSFTDKDIVNMFFEEYLRFSVRCTLTDKIGIAIDDNDFMSCEISLYGIDDMEHLDRVQINDGYAEITYLNSDDVKGILGVGLFDIDKDCAGTVREENKTYIMAEKIGFIEYANLQITPQNVEYENIGLYFTWEYSDRIPIELDSILITQSSLLDCICMLNKRLENAEFILQLNKQNNIPTVQSNTQLTFEGNIPPKTDQDKLARFIELIIQKSEFMKDGRVPTYSELHTMLSHKYPHEAIPSKNTIKKYLGQH